MRVELGGSVNAAAAALRHLCQAWSTRDVPGYRRGETALRVARELQAEWPTLEPADDDGIRLASPAGSTGCLLHEIVERHFLMHIVNVGLSIRVPASVSACGVIRLHHAGTFRRGALLHRLAGAHDRHTAALAQRVCDDPDVRTMLDVLDVRRCEVVGQGDAWELRIEPFGGCEVVNRVPAYRRHVKLGEVQVRVLHGAANALVAAIGATG